MRFLLVPFMLVLLGSFPAVAGQMPMASLVVEKMESTPADANATIVQFDLSRRCANPTLVLDAQVVAMAIMYKGENWTLDGPAQAAFEQQVCATQMQQTVQAAFTLHPTPTAFAATEVAHPFALRIRADQASPTTPAIPEQTVPFTVSTPALPPEPMVVEEPARELPGLGLVGALLALGAVAVALARRR